MLATIGYENCILDDFVDTLSSNKINILVDIRERAQSRKPGFSKTALSHALSNEGIGYLHFRALGDPKAGREAARAGMSRKFRHIYGKVLASEAAQDALLTIENLISNNRICLLCYERDFRECHRKIVADHIESKLGCEAIHLSVGRQSRNKNGQRRVFHSRQSATA